MSISRSTKLVIIERLLLLAERYVITIEVTPVSFTSLQVNYGWIKPQREILIRSILFNNLNHIL